MISINYKQFFKNQLIYLISAMTIFLLAGCVEEPGGTKTNIPDRQSALEIALKQLNKEYVWGGRGPDNFDCSGLITYSYKMALERNYIFNIDGWVTDDATMQDLYDYNVEIISLSRMKPGDIIFMTDTEGEITHGGLFREWIQENKRFKFVHASSYYGKVIEDTWYINNMDRDLWFVNAGRFEASRSYWKW